jgi:hypothetical protein
MSVSGPLPHYKTRTLSHGYTRPPPLLMLMLFSECLCCRFNVCCILIASLSECCYLSSEYFLILCMLMYFCQSYCYCLNVLLFFICVCNSSNLFVVLCFYYSLWVFCNVWNGFVFFLILYTCCVILRMFLLFFIAVILYVCFIMRWIFCCFLYVSLFFISVCN